MNTSSLILAALVWQLGVKDGSDRDFLYRYNAWEYGNAPQLRTEPCFNAQTHVWRHVIAEDRAYPSVRLPVCLVPIYEA